MPRLSQSELDALLERGRSGELSPAQWIVEKFRMERVHLVTSRLPAAVRTALREAVKAGQLGHVAKDGHRPEAFYHPTFAHLVAGERNAHARSVLVALAGVVARPGGPDAEDDDGATT